MDDERTGVGFRRRRFYAGEVVNGSLAVDVPFDGCPFIRRVDSAVNRTVHLATSGTRVRELCVCVAFDLDWFENMFEPVQKRTFACLQLVQAPLFLFLFESLSMGVEQSHDCGLIVWRLRNNSFFSRRCKADRLPYS